MIQTIAIVDDSATARLITKRCLEIAGCLDAEFLEAKNGKEALELLRKNHNVNLVVTDITMPEMDGYSLLKHLKTSPRLTTIPVVVISSAANDAKSEELRRLGVLATLSKPISPATVAKVLEKLTEEEL